MKNFENSEIFQFLQTSNILHAFGGSGTDNWTLFLNNYRQEIEHKSYILEKTFELNKKQYQDELEILKLIIEIEKAKKELKELTPKDENVEVDF